ncbi:MAG: hypothetical protein JAY74_17755 [Candidatus Thiodiazotropha taylori]|nr:hypothetical protein [Candidatus Thiodiazotropha taylori]
MNMNAGDLKTVHDAQVRFFKSHLDARLETIKAYRSDEQDETINTPALLLELERIDEGSDAGDGRDALRCSFTAHCILSNLTDGVEIEVRNFAATVFRLLKGARFGLEELAGDPEAITAGPGEFKPGAEGYESWYVNWEQNVYIGESMWEGGIVPHTVKLGWSPDVGIGHADDYEQVTE